MKALTVADGANSLLVRDVYCVCFPEVDGIDSLHGDFARLREAYFSGGRKTIKLNESRVISGFEGRLRGRISKGRIFWRKSAGSTNLEEIFAYLSDHILVKRDFQGIILSRVFFDREHRWIKSEYYQAWNPNAAKVIFKPQANSDQIIRFDYDEDRHHYICTTLHPMAYRGGSEEQLMLSTRLGEPKLIVSTAQGDFCYCTPAELEAREKALELIRQEGTPGAHVWQEPKEDTETEETEPEIIFPGLEEYAQVSSAQTEKERGEISEALAGALAEAFDEAPTGLSEPTESDSEPIAAEEPEENPETALAAPTGLSELAESDSEPTVAEEPGEHSETAQAAAEEASNDEVLAQIIEEALAYEAAEAEAENTTEESEKTPEEEGAAAAVPEDETAEEEKPHTGHAVRNSHDILKQAQRMLFGGAPEASFEHPENESVSEESTESVRAPAPISEDDEILAMARRLLNQAPAGLSEFTESDSEPMAAEEPEESSETAPAGLSEFTESDSEPTAAEEPEESLETAPAGLSEFTESDSEPTAAEESEESSETVPAGLSELIGSDSEPMEDVVEEELAEEIIEEEPVEELTEENLEQEPGENLETASAGLSELTESDSEPTAAEESEESSETAPAGLSEFTESDSEPIAAEEPEESPETALAAPAGLSEPTESDSEPMEDVVEEELAEEIIEEEPVEELTEENLEQEPGENLETAQAAADAYPLAVENGMVARTQITPDGFNAKFYRDGTLSYAGADKDGKRSGLGVSFRKEDHALHIANWTEGLPGAVVSLFDSTGNLRFGGKIVDGKKQGAGVSLRQADGSVFVGQWKDGEPTGLGAFIDPDGCLLYYGGWQNGKRSGHGTQFDKEGRVVYDGEWRDGKYYNGTLFQELSPDSWPDDVEPPFEYNS